MSHTTTTPIIADRHEALYLRVAALFAQVQAFAARRPEELVPDGVKALAEDLLFDARPFTRIKRRHAIPVAALDYAGLAVQLGQALAELDAFETQHSEWRPDLAGFFWRVAGAEPLPVRRLRTRISAPTPPDLVAAMVAMQRRLRHHAENLGKKRG